MKINPTNNQISMSVMTNKEKINLGKVRLIVSDYKNNKIRATDMNLYQINLLNWALVRNELDVPEKKVAQEIVNFWVLGK